MSNAHAIRWTMHGSFKSAAPCTRAGLNARAREKTLLTAVYSQVPQCPLNLGRNDRQVARARTWQTCCSARVHGQDLAAINR